MPRFVDRQRRIVISTNYKVMYSTLAAHANLAEVGEFEAWRLARDSEVRHLLLVREPLSRLTSAFADKFRVQPRSLGTEAFVGWQRVHRVTFKHIGLRASDSDSAIADRLIHTSFEDFVEILPRIIWLDGHLRPQYLLLAARMKRLVPIADAHVSEIRRLEELDSDEMQEWGIRAEERRNPTPSWAREVEVTPRSRAVVSRLYRHDYDRFGYPLP